MSNKENIRYIILRIQFSYLKENKSFFMVNNLYKKIKKIAKKIYDEYDMDEIMSYEDDFFKNYYNENNNSCYCTICGIDIGKNNPRQLCEKTYCPEMHF
uniref:Uncharacterized protein n=1 Tax=viral metagenome TaxID=1070528 RepID=A0A6C0ADF5_9ZZZZ